MNLQKVIDIACEVGIWIGIGFLIAGLRGCVW